jgi:hypothetical protein
MALRTGRQILPLLLVSLSALVGCQDIGLPQLFDPRSESQKLAEAKKFDPYPDPTLGQDITGARPRGFLNPRPDPDASKLQTRGPWPPAGPTTAYAAPATYPATGPVYASPAATYPPSTVAYPSIPPATSLQLAPTAAPPMYPPAGAANAAPATTLYASPPTAAVQGAGSAAPLAYGKAIGSP